MSRKIIGVTVGTTLPKPNFEQNDPTKGDYIKNKPDFEGLQAEVNVISETVDNKADVGHNHDDKYYTKAQIDNYELITTNDIDTICGTTIEAVNADEAIF